MSLSDVLTGSIEALPSYVGKVLSGKYAVLGGLGAGAMGTVFEAENVSVGRRVALKVLNPQYASNREVLLRFEREARAAAKICHPNIVDVLDMGHTDDGLPFIVMECLEGADLYHVLQDGGPLNPTRAVDIAIQILEALGAAHVAGIVHRDLKPENVFLTQRGARSDFVKLLDFGIAKCRDAIAGATRVTLEGSTLGTPAYMSPEQACGKTDLDARSDLYSVGVLLFEMLSGRPVHDGANYNQILAAIISQDSPSLLLAAPCIAPDLADVVDRAMARCPDERFQSAAELIAALEPFAQIGSEVPTVRRTVPPLAARPSTPLLIGELEVPTAVPPPDLSSRRSKRLWIGAVSCTLVAMVGTLGLLFGARAEHGEPTRARRVVSTRWVPPPQAVEPARVSVSLDVLSNARGARVLLDGRLVGLSPLRQSLPADSQPHLLRVEAEGYRSEDRTIVLSAPLRIAVELQPNARRPPAAAATPRKARPIKAGGLPFDEF